MTDQSTICGIMMLWGYTLFVGITLVDASNWAQTSGKISQNVVFSAQPSPALRHWQSRFGHATVIAENTNPDPEAPDLGYIYLLGGDTNTGDITDRDSSPGALDISWGNGYKNDVWQSSGTEWATGGDLRERGRFRNGGGDRVMLGGKQKLPRTTSMMSWDQTTPGSHPEPGMSYDNWIVCQPYFSNSKYAAARATYCSDGVNPVMWSPRRHHAATYFNGYIYVLGGRSREFVELANDRSVGGIVHPRVADVPYEGENSLQKMTTVREAIVYKSDVWKSQDGESWELVTPGCKANSDNLVAFGNSQTVKYGTAERACTSEADCYGGESCDTNKKTCICQMWSPREQHAIAIFDEKMYISGGYASRLYSDQTGCGDYACGDSDSSAYRYYLDDVWYSSDGESWSLATEAAWGYPRGGHQMIVLDPGPTVFDYSGSDTSGTASNPALLILGGRGGDNTGMSNFTSYYYNDIQWSFDGVTWSRLYGGYAPGYNSSDASATPIFQTDSSYITEPNDDDANSAPTPAPSGAPLGSYTYGEEKSNLPAPTRVGSADETWWAPRTGHTVSVEEPTPGNNYQRTVYLVGGQGVHYKDGGMFEDVWSWRPDVYGDLWRKDFTDKALFSTGEGTNYRFEKNSPAIHYVTPDSDVEYMQSFVIPTRLDRNDSQRYQLRNYLTDQNIADMKLLGINSIRDLADAPKYTILKLRGYDFPQIEMKNRMTFTDVCDARALAQAIVEKCTVTIPKRLYIGEKNQPWNVYPEWAMGPPTDMAQPVAWHGHTRKSYDFLNTGADDSETLLEEWDGCTYVEAIEGLFGPNVNGLGYVDQVPYIRDPLPELQNLQCKWTPGPRAYHSALVFEERLYLFGGKKTETEFYADTWYRDAALPTVRIRDAPPDSTPYPLFEFAANEPGVSFEYLIWDPYYYKEIRPWTPVVKKHDIGWLDWRKGGPGNGLYSLYVRSVDPAGNRDEKFFNGINVYTWYYVSPTPWDIIAQAVAGFIALVALGYLEYRRRVRKAAMERYAMKRMRRKFKAMQRDIDGRAVDWRTLYMENKAAEEAQKGNKKAKRAIRDKKKEARTKVSRENKGPS